MQTMSRFTDSIDRYCKGLHVAPGAAAVCDECLDTYGISNRDERGRFRSVDAMQEELYEVESSGSFSWRWCDTCGSSFGGDRHDAHGLTDDGQVIHLDICTDCLFYFANGDEPEEWHSSPSEVRLV